MGKAYSASVGLGPVTDPISFVTREALGLEHAFSPDLSLEVEIKLVWIFVLPRQAVMQLLEAMPANAPLDLLDGFLFPDQDAQGLAVQRITGFQFANREGDAEGCLAHGSNISESLQTQSAARSGDAPVWGQSDPQARGLAVNA